MKSPLFYVAVAALGLAACAGPPPGDASPAATGDTSTESPSDWSGNTLRVPEEFPTIQAAVDATGPGDLVLVSEGVYRESVKINTPGVTLRGTDRNAVIIDGEFERANGVEVLFTDGVVVENITSRNNTLNGFFWSGVRGYRGSYLTAVNNGDYGIYAFDSGDGLFEHSYATGSPDAAYYIGQCNPCNAVISDSVGEYSGLGYSGSNASTDLFLVNNVFRYNGAGIAPNSWDGELLPPVESVAIVGNLVHDNGVDEDGFPFKGAQFITQGNGILLTGAHDSIAARNRVFNHPMNGIFLHSNIDKNVWQAGDNTVTGNVVEGSGLADLTMAGPSLSGNCFEDNEFSRSMPAAIETLQGCTGLRFPALFEMGSLTSLFGRLVEHNLEMFEEVFYGDMPHPADQPQMPGGVDAPVSPAVNVFSRPDLDSIGVPPMPAGIEITQQKGFNLMGVTFASTIGGFLGLYAYVLPLVLYAAWVAIAIWEIVTRRDDLSTAAGVGWVLAILVLPFVGVIAYYLFGKSQIPKVYRWVMLAGGMGAYVLFLVLGLAIGGIV